MRLIPLSLFLLALSSPAWAQTSGGGAPPRRNIAPNAPFGSEIYTDGDNPEVRDPDQMPLPPGSDIDTKVTPEGAVPHPVILFPYGTEGMPRQQQKDVYKIICPQDNAPKAPEPNKILLERQEREPPRGGGIRLQPGFGSETRWGTSKRCYVDGYPKPKAATDAAADGTPVAPVAGNTLSPVRPSHLLLNPYVAAPTSGALPVAAPVATPPAPTATPAGSTGFSAIANQGFSKPPVLTPPTKAALDALTPVQQQRYTSTVQSMVRQNPNRTPTDAEIQLLTQAAKG